MKPRSWVRRACVIALVALGAPQASARREAPVRANGGRQSDSAAFRKVLKAEGYAQRPSSLQFVVKLNALAPPADFYTRTDRWHITLGDSDQDR